MIKHVRRQLLPYLDGDMPQAERLAIEQHLSQCVTCQDELNELRRGYQAMRAMPPLAAPDGLADAVMERVRLATDRRESATELAATRRTTSAASVRRLIGIAAAWLLTLAGAGALGYRLGGAEATVSPAPTPVAATLPGGEFLLILLEADSTWPPRLGQRRSGYTEWAGGLRAAGRLVNAEKLTDDRGELVAQSGMGSVQSGELVSGFFIVRAADYREAVELAMRSPHLRYGRILVREID